MARQDSLSILTESEGKAKLAEEYGKVIDNVAKGTISARIKNKDLSGDPHSGSVEAKRFKNSTSKKYGTARTGGKGEKIHEKPVTVSIDQDQELINEVEEKDTRLYGVSGLIERKARMDQRSMERELEKAFFQTAVDAGTDASLKKTKINEKVSELIGKIEKVKNDYVDGVPRDMIKIILDSDTYNEMRDYLDTTQNSNVDTSQGEFGRFHGVEVFSSVYLPEGTQMLGMVEGAVAQPVMTTMDEAGKFPASNAYHFGMFYSYGTKAVMEDLIFFSNAAA